MAFVDVLKWDTPPNVLAWKYPSDSLTTWTQLIVSESQEAYLLKEGQFVGPFGPGRHRLSTENYPILTSLMTLAVSGGKTPYTAEVWFIQKAFTLDIKWGTSDAMQLEDPRFHIMLPVRAFGRYGIQVTNSALFLSKMVGTLPAYTTKTVSEFFKGMLVREVKNLIARYVVEKQICLLQMSAYISEISDAIEEILVQKLSKYGVSICNFAINSISTDDSDPAVARLRRALAERAEMDILGFNYQQKRSYDVMETAAANEGSGSVQAPMMGAGMGMALGMGFGQNMGAQAAQVTAQAYPQVVQCPSCRTPLAPGARFCGNCGTRLETQAPQQKFCSSCGTANAPGARFCCGCGNRLA